MLENSAEPGIEEQPAFPVLLNSYVKCSKCHVLYPAQNPTLPSSYPATDIGNDGDRLSKEWGHLSSEANASGVFVKDQEALGAEAGVVWVVALGAQIR